MIFLTFQVVWSLSTLVHVLSNTVSSPQIRILDVATKASETRVIPHRVDYRNSFHPYFQQPNHYEQDERPQKSYVIYDEYPLKIFKEWKAYPPANFPPSAPLELNRQPNDFPPEYYFQNRQQVLQPPKPTLAAYKSVYSNVIKVFDNSLDGRFHGDRFRRPFEGNAWRPQPPEYDSMYPQDNTERQQQHNLPENFPSVFSPSENFHFPSFGAPPRIFNSREGFYNTYTVNYDENRHKNEVELLPDVATKQKSQKKAFLCGFIRLNDRQFPGDGGPCGRSEDDLPLVHPEYPDYSNLPNDKIPLEHRRQHFQIKRIKRSERRQKRQVGFGYGYSSWGSPFGYESGYDGYFGDNYNNRRRYISGYYSNRNRNQGYRNNRYNSGSRFDDYYDDYQNNNDDSTSRGLTGYLTNGGRRYKSRRNNNNNDNNDDDDYDNDDDNNNNNSNNNNNNDNNDDSDEEMERMNSNRRDNDRRNNNDDSRDRRRNNNNYNNYNNNNNNNNNNDDDDYRDNRRNNNRNNNNRRNNNYNNNGRRHNNDRYDNYNGRNRNNNNNNNGYGNDNYGNNNGYGNNYGYGNNNGYGNNGYGNSNSYGSGNGYGSSNGYSSSYGGYGSNYGGYGNGGYGSSYGSNGGYGYGGYGNGFGF